MNTTHRRIIVVVGLLIVLVGGILLQSPDPGSERVTARFAVNGSIQPTVSLEVADEPDEWRTGLMHRTNLADGAGMLFLFPEEQVRTFWMRDTYIALDIIFLTADKQVINVEHAHPQPDASIDELRRYHSADPAQYVIEVPRGYADKHGIVPGTRVHLNGLQ